MNITLTAPINKTVLSGGNITLSWSQSGLSGVTYNVYVQQNTGEFVAVATGLTKMNYTLSNVDPGQSISWYVVAFSVGNIVAAVSETWSFYTSLTLTQNGFDLLLSTNNTNTCEIASRDDWVTAQDDPTVNTSQLNVGGANIETLSYNTKVNVIVPKLANVAMKFFGFGFAIRAPINSGQNTVLASIMFGQKFLARAVAVKDGTIQVIFSYNNTDYKTTLASAKEGVYYYVALSLSKNNVWHLWKYTSNYVHKDHSVSVQKLQTNLLIAGSRASLKVNPSYDPSVVYGVQNIAVLARGIDPNNRADVQAFRQFGMASETGFTTSAFGVTTHYYALISNYKKQIATVTTGAYGTFGAKPPIIYPDNLSFLWGSGIDDEYVNEVGIAPSEINQLTPHLCGKRVLQSPSLLGYWDFRDNSSQNKFVPEKSGLNYFYDHAYNNLSTSYYSAVPSGMRICGTEMPNIPKYSMTYTGHIPYLSNMTVASSFYFFALDTSLLTRSSVVPLTFNNKSITTLNNYTMQFNIPYTEKMNPDFSDVAFTDASGTRIPFWLTSFIPGTSATFNVFFTTIPAEESVTIYMYYGNPDITHSEGSLSETYPLFSLTGEATDWLTGSLFLSAAFTTHTLSKPTNNNGWIRLMQSADHFVVAHSLNISQPFTLSFDVKAPEGKWSAILWQGDSETPTHSIEILGDVNNSSYGNIQLYSDTQKTTTNSVNPEGSHHIDLVSDGTNVTLYIDNTAVLGPISYSVTDFQGIAFGTWGNSAAPEFNNVTLKSYNYVGNIKPTFGTAQSNVGNLFVDPQQDMILFNAFGISLSLISPLNTTDSPNNTYMMRFSFPNYSFISPFSAPNNDSPERLVQTYKDDKVIVKSIFIEQRDITRMFTIPATWTLQVGKSVVDGNAGVRLYYNGELITEVDITGFTPEAQIYNFSGLSIGANMSCVEFRDYALFQNNLPPKSIQATQPVIKFLTPIVQGSSGVYTMSGVWVDLQDTELPYQIYVRHSAIEPSQKQTTFVTANEQTVTAYDPHSQWPASDWELIPENKIYNVTDEYIQYKIVAGGQV